MNGLLYFAHSTSFSLHLFVYKIYSCCQVDKCKKKYNNANTKCLSGFSVEDKHRGHFRVLVSLCLCGETSLHVKLYIRMKMSSTWREVYFLANPTYFKTGSRPRGLI